MQSTKREDMLNTAHRIAEHTNVLIVCSSNHVSQMLHKEQCDHLRNVGVEFDLCMDKCISLKNGKRIFFRPFTGSPRHILGFDAFTMLDDFEAYRLDHDLQLYIETINKQKIEGDPNIADILRTHLRN